MDKILEFCPLFKGLSIIQIDESFSKVHYQVKQYSKGQTIALSGDECRSLQILLDGNVKGEMNDFSGRVIKIERIKHPKIITLKIKVMFTPVFQHSNAYTLKSSVDYASGAIVSKIVTKNDAGNITLFAFDKGQNLSKHSAPYDAIIQILEGNGRITIDEQTHLLAEGQMIIMPANVPHAVDADEPFKMMLVMIKGK